MLVDTNTLAQALDVTPRRVQQLAKEGMPTAGRGQWELIPCLHWYIRRLRAISQGAVAADERARHEGYKADMARLDLEERQRKLVPVGQVAQEVGRILTTLKLRLLGIPGRVARELADTKKPQKVKATLNKEIRAALNQAAEDLESDDSSEPNNTDSGADTEVPAAQER